MNQLSDLVHVTTNHSVPGSIRDNDGNNVSFFLLKEYSQVTIIWII